MTASQENGQPDQVTLAAWLQRAFLGYRHLLRDLGYGNYLSYEINRGAPLIWNDSAQALRLLLDWNDM